MGLVVRRPFWPWNCATMLTLSATVVAGLKTAISVLKKAFWAPSAR
jgi:hypothetical protein